MVINEEASEMGSSGFRAETLDAFCWALPAKVLPSPAGPRDRLW